MSHHPGKFTWFDHLSGDTRKAGAFYSALFGWKVKAMPMGTQTYEMLHNGDDGIGGITTAPPGAPPCWISYLSVSDVDASYQAALKAGAQSLMAPANLGDVGRTATIADPTGAVLSLWHGAQGDREDKDNLPFGDWCWNELWTPDAKKSLAFYQGVFGFTDEPMDMGAQGMYHVLKSADGKSRAGLMQPAPGAPNLWCPYVRVADCDATLDKATGLGAKAMMPAMDVPNIGRIAMMTDPQGACFAFIKTVPM